MSKGINNVLIMGNVTRDPEVKTVGQGNGVKKARFSVAVGKRWKDKTTGEYKEKTTFINCVAWGNTASVVEQYVTKGRQVIVQGELQIDEVDNNGEKKYYTSINVADLTLCGGAQQQATTGTAQPITKPIQQQPKLVEQNLMAGLDDFTGGDDEPEVDIPF